MGRTFYDVLGVDEDAEKGEIRATYRAKAKEHHPDVSDDPQAGERFKRINRAAEVLGDPVERKRYDRLGHDAYLASEGGVDAGSSDAGGAGSDETTTAGTAQETATDGVGPSAGATGTGTATGPEAGSTGPWGHGSAGSADGTESATDAAGSASANATGTPGAGTSAARSGTGSDGPWTGFRDVDHPGAASSGGTIGAGVHTNPERTARWERAHDPHAGREAARAAWESTPPTRPNAWLLALSMVGSGRVLDQWSAFRHGLLLVYLYPVLLVVLLAQIAPPITVAAAALVVFIAVYGSGIPNVGTLVFGLLGGLLTVILLQSPYPLSSPTARVLLAATWVPLGHSVFVAWLLHRSRQ